MRKSSESAGETGSRGLPGGEQRLSKVRACRAVALGLLAQTPRYPGSRQPSDSKACQVTGQSRDTFYRYKSAVDDGGIDALLEEDRKLGVYAERGRGIWLRHDLANFKLRLKVLEAKLAEDDLFLTESQVQALEKKLDDKACGEIETAHPGYLGAQDTFYVGTLKGVGRIYQQSFVDIATASQSTR